jgi:ribosomal protein L24E
MEAKAEARGGIALKRLKIIFYFISNNCKSSAFASMKRPVQVRFMATVRQRAAMEPATFTIRDGWVKTRI